MRTVFLRGDYESREDNAKRLGCALVLHQHFNSGDGRANYCLVEIATATAKEKAFAADLAKSQAKVIGISLYGETGVKVLKDGERGEFIIDETKCAVINEPLFVSNAAGAKWIKSIANREKLAKAIAACIKRHFGPNDLIGLSVGHKYKTSSPEDRGADVVGGGSEADLAELLLARVDRLLRADVFPIERTTNRDTALWTLTNKWYARIPAGRRVKQYTYKDAAGMVEIRYGWWPFRLKCRLDALD